MTLDLSDPLVLHMARHNHIPEENWLISGEVMVTCEQCGQNWPCETRLRILAIPYPTPTHWTGPDAPPQA